MKYTAVVLAGSRPGRDEFAASFGADLKALIPVGGEPMVCRPVRALLASEHIGDVIVLTQAPLQIANALPRDPRVQVRASGDTIATTMLALCKDASTQWPVLVTTADHALLDAAMIDEFCAKAEGADIAVAMVERRALLTRLPTSRRTWITLRGGAYSGANLFLLASPSVAPAIALWRGVEQDRKKGMRLLSAMGPMVLVGGLLRLLTLDQIAARIGRKLGLTIRPVVMSDPLAAVDVDKPDDHALVEDLLEGRG